MEGKGGGGRRKGEGRYHSCKKCNGICCIIVEMCDMLLGNRYKELTTPMVSPLPNSSISSFFPSIFLTTDRTRPFRMMYAASASSPCL